MWSETFRGLSHKWRLLEHLFVHYPYKQLKLQQNVNKREWIFKTSLESYLLYYTIRIYKAFLRPTDQCMFHFPQNVIYFTDLSLWVIEIYLGFFWKACAIFYYFTNLSRRVIEIFRFFWKHEQYFIISQFFPASYRNFQVFLKSMRNILLFHKFVPGSYRNIQVFFEKHAQYFNTLTEK